MTQDPFLRLAPRAAGPDVGNLTRRALLAGSATALAAAGFPPGIGQRFVLAQPATPAASPTAEEVAAFFVQFFHFEKFFAPMGVVLDEETLAGFYGLDVETYQELRGQFDANARQAAEDLLADADFASRVDQLPFASGDTVVGLGDSITDDLQSWLEILRHILALRRPDEQITVVNQGISGDTTSDAIPRAIPIIAAQPAWIICMLGTNDAARYGRQATKPLVSLEETALNLTELRHLAGAESAVNWAWITAPPCNEELIATNPYSAVVEMTIRNDDLGAIAEVIRAEPDPVVDLFALFGVPPAADLILSDGVHPSLAGQQATVRALVEQLTA